METDDPYDLQRFVAAQDAGGTYQAALARPFRTGATAERLDQRLVSLRDEGLVLEPDDDLGERIVAWVVLESDGDATAAELSEHVASLLTKHKRPREVNFIDELPRNAMGKVVKRELGT